MSIDKGDLDKSGERSTIYYDILGNLYKPPYKSTRYINIDKRKSDTSKALPILYRNKHECCGCTACYSICSKHAIQMLPDEEGFKYPVVDAEICIGCRLCTKVCPIKS